MFWSNISTKAIQNIIFRELSLHAYRREKEGISGDHTPLRNILITTLVKNLELVLKKRPKSLFRFTQAKTWNSWLICCSMLRLCGRQVRRKIKTENRSENCHAVCNMLISCIIMFFEMKESECWAALQTGRCKLKVLTSILAA